MALGTTAKAMADELKVSKNLFYRVRTYFSEVRSEMRRVTWPNKQEIYGMTVMVILTTFLFGFYFWVTDGVFSTLVARILNHFLR